MYKPLNINIHNICLTYSKFMITFVAICDDAIFRIQLLTSKITIEFKNISLFMWSPYFHQHIYLLLYSVFTLIISFFEVIQHFTMLLIYQVLYFTSKLHVIVLYYIQQEYILSQASVYDAHL